MYSEEEMLALSGIQHYSFCPRQWALIHVEQQWADNVLTVEGGLVHKRAHNQGIREKRGDVITVRELNVHSYSLGLRGQCDVVEFVADDEGIPLTGEPGFWRVVPVEYKRGKSKRIDADRLQLCAQAICLEEMLCCDVREAFLYYGSTHSRERVDLTSELRAEAMRVAGEMHRLFANRHTPSPKKRKTCTSCSLKDKCLPGLDKHETVQEYFDRRLREMQ